jgi:hypothetical protein
VKSAKSLVLVVLVPLLAGAGWFLLSHWSESRKKEAAERAHEQAMRRWAEFVKSGFKGENKEIVGKLEHPDKSGVVYMWNWDLGHGGEGDGYFCVVVEG